MKQFHINRLKKLVEKLKTVPTKNFDMFTWWGEFGRGATGCAMGWACQIPAFRKAGLRIRNAVPYYKKTNNCGYECIRDFFSTAHNETRSIFHSVGYTNFTATKTDVIRKLNECIEENQEVLNKGYKK